MMSRTLVVFLFTLLHVDIFLTTPVPTEPQHAAWRISRLRHSRHLGGRSGNHLSDDFLPHVVPLPARQAAAGNRKPVFSNCSRYQASVREEQNPGTEVVRVTAVDRDPPDTGGTVTYTFVSAPGERLKFDIDPDTGRIVTRNVFDRDEPSREKEMYLTVRATDNGRPQLDDVCTIKVTIEDVNDNKPVFDKVNYVESVPQDLRAGREVMRISATDIDDGNNSVVTYELRPRNAELDQGYFRVDPATGVIYLNRTLDREPGYKFRMNATATDQGDPPRSSHIELEILVVESHKKAPTFTQVPERAIVLSENYNEYQRPVATLVAESNIAESELVFMILPGRTEQTNSRNTFVLESEGSTARVKLGRQLDYEAASEYTITVRVQNKYNLAAETVLNIQVLDVNDNIPVFTEVASGTVLEHEPEGAPVMQVRAIDADGTAQHSQVTYELGDHQDLFSIDPYTGNITTRVMFDREDKDFYIVKVVASDNSPSALLTTGESNKGQQVFHIEIGDINDNRPRFTKRVYFAEVTEDENIHSLVTEVRALDNDTASEVTYSLENGNVGEAFLVEKNTGKIRVANALDYENTTSYTLLVRAFDGIYDDYATVEVRVDNVNDNRPVFLPSNRNITIMEEHLVSGCITRLEAYDPDVPRREDSQRIRFFLVKEEQKRYLTLERDGCLSLVKPLDRDSPRGFPQWQVLVLARDEDGGPSSLSESTEVVINLVDINDNAPFLSQQQSVVWPENRTPGVITTLHADDLDGEGHAAPFQFSLALTAEDEIRTSFRVSVGGDGVARLEALRTFDREYRREYGVPIAISDSGSPSMTGTSTLTVVVGDENDNSMRPGASDIFVYNFKGLEDTVIGRVYVEDPDDWDLADKRFAWLGGVPHPNFQLDPRTGELSVLGDPATGSYLLEFLVVEESRLVARHAVGASVTVTVRRIPEEAVIKSGSMRLANISAESFVEPPPGKLQSRRDVLRDQLATLLNVSADNVDVFTVLPTDSGEFLDVRYSVHGSPYYAPERLDGAVAQRLRDMELMLGVRVWTTPVDACLEENVCDASSCVSRLVVASRPHVVTTNTSSFVGVHAAVQHECGCERMLKYQASCLNGGTPTDHGCDCPPGHEGPNCEVIDVGFSGDGWAWYPPPAACETASLSLELQTDREDGLVFYLGPLSTATGLRLSDFMSLELTEGHARLLADYGSGTTKLEQPQLKLSDGRKHRIEIHWSAASIELKVDSCATCLALTAPEGPSQLLNVNGPLQLGGTSLNLDQLAHDLGWKYTPTDQGLSGCVRNLTFSGNVYELGAPSVSHRAVAGCARAVAKAVTLGVDTNFLLVVLACTALLFALVAAAAALRGRGEAAAWRERGDEDVRENIVCYEDEGGGEGDMTGYDLSVLRLLYEETAGITKTKQAPRAAPEGMAETGSDLVESARQAEMSTDDLRHYAYEGDGDSVGSLSSLASGTDEGDLSFVQLHDFGPRFRKLADMYGGQSSDEEEV